MYRDRIIKRPDRGSTLRLPTNEVVPFNYPLTTFPTSGMEIDNYSKSDVYAIYIFDEGFSTLMGAATIDLKSWEEAENIAQLYLMWIEHD